MFGQGLTLGWTAFSVTGPTTAGHRRAGMRGLALAAFLALAGMMTASAGLPWTTTGALNTAHAWHTATLLPDGMVLIAGGSNATSAFLATAELYDPTTGMWAGTTGTLNTPRQLHTATLLPDGTVLVAGGFGGIGGSFSVLASAEVYDPEIGTWTTAPGWTSWALNTPRCQHTATLLTNGTVLVVGGADGSGNSLASAEVFDPAIGRWTYTLHPPQTARARHTATLLPNGQVLVAGGVDSSGNPLSSAEVYDPTAGTWTATANPLNTARQHHTATLLPNGQAMVAGGLGAGGTLAPGAELYDPSSGKWTSTGDLNTARESHTATLLPNGKVLVAGGAGSSGNPLSSAEVYDPSVGTWTTDTAALNTARQFHTATLLPNGQVLIAGGVDSTPKATSSAELGDPAQGAWTTTTVAMSTGRWQQTATLLPNGQVLVAGGRDTLDDSGDLSSAELYDPASQTWKNTGALNSARRSATATLLASGRVLVAGGAGGLSSAELYDPDGGTWAASGSLSTGRYFHTATLLPNGQVLVAGGWGPGVLSSAELYDPAKGTWTPTGDLKMGRYNHTATLLPNGMVLVAGGGGNSGALPSAELYDLASGTWTYTHQSLNAARAYHTATLLPSGKVLVAAGYGSSGNLSSAELYDPASDTWTMTGALNAARIDHTATLLPNGQVLVAGGSSSTGYSMSSAELYDPAGGAWTTTGPLNAARFYNTATLLPDGHVLVAGGLGSSGILSSAELYDVGLGFTEAWRPQIATVTSPFTSGNSLVLSGSGFRGLSEGSSGNSQDSPTDYPLVQLRSVESGQTVFLTPAPWSATSFTSAPVGNFLPGYALATVFVNGIPSVSALVDFNTAPILNPAITPVLNAELENAGTPLGPVGTLVSSLVDIGGPLSNVTDAVPGAVTGIALTGGAYVDPGTWYYSADNGTTWSRVPEVSPANALLLAADANTRIYFQPNANFSGTINNALTFQAWDQTSGTNAGSADATINGGSTAFSTDTETADLTIWPPKTAYDNSNITTGKRWVTFGNGSAVIDGAETTATYGQTFIAPSESVLDDWTFYLQQISGGLGTAQNFEFFLMAWDPSSGMATGPVLYQSGLQTVTPGQTSYTPFTVYPNVVLTPGNQYVMFINESGLNGDVEGSLELGGNGPFFFGSETSPLGGQFVYQYSGDDFWQVTSMAWQTWTTDGYAAYKADFSPLIVAPNTAPVLNTAIPPLLNAELENAGPPSGPVGTSIDHLVELTGPLFNVTDPDLGAVTGIALINADTSSGTWYYSADNGSTWSGFPSPLSQSAALLLAADGYTRIYFQPNANFSGPISSAVAFQAWDQTSGVNGGTADATANGGYTAFSTGIDTADLTILASTCPGNLGWPSACALTLAAQQNQPNVLHGQMYQSLDNLDETRWYAFAVAPGSQLTVTLTDLPANYELFLFQDIAASYQALAGPTTTTTTLAQLGAEFSPTAFSPTAFSPTAFSPTAFSPTAFSPTAFSPTAFSPTAFSPTAFSPTAFSPTAFSPTAFSPTAFSPTAFSPTAFSPTAFSPTAFSPTAFSAAQTRSLVGVSAFPGLAGQGIVANTWENSGNYYVCVHGQNGAFAPGQPFLLDVYQAQGSCPPLPAPAPLTAPAPAGNFNTIIITDVGRMNPSGDPGVAQQIATMQQKLSAFASRSEVAGVVVDMDSIPEVVSANATADAYVPCTFAKNIVGQAIKNVILSYEAQNPLLQYVVLVGNDSVIPYFRHPDLAGLANETDYYPPVLDNTSSQAALRLSQVLSQDDYGSVCGLSINGSTFPIPDLAVGRLVEEPAEISGMLDAYAATGGVIPTPTSAFVSGYDFMLRAAVAIDNEFSLGIGFPTTAPGTVNDELLAGTVDNPMSPQDPNVWTAVDLRNALVNTRHDLIFLGGHFDEGGALAADWTTLMTAAELAASSANLVNAIVLGCGCHVGYNTVDTQVIPNVTPSPDWARAFAQKQVGAFIGGTGYQYGDTDFLAYNDLLYLDVVQQLLAGNSRVPVSVGNALMAAKRQYMANTPAPRGIDEKALLQTTLFGLPMLSVNLPYGRSPVTGPTSIVNPPLTSFPASPPPASPGAVLGLQYADVDIDTSQLTVNTVSMAVYPVPASGPLTVDATYLSASGGQFTEPCEPVLPLIVEDATVQNTVLRGVVFTGGAYADTQGVLPLTGAPATEIRGVSVPFQTSVLYPLQPWSVNYCDGLCNAAGGSTRLMLFPAQYETSAPGSDVGTRRTFSDMAFRLYYSANTQTYYDANNVPSTPCLANPPSISGVSATSATIAGNPQVTFQTHVVGNPAAGIQEVWITYTAVGGAWYGQWESTNLIQQVQPVVDAADEDSTLWVGSVTLPNDGTSAQDVRFFVQAVNGVGLVAMDTRQGAFYTPGAPTPQPTTLTFGSFPPQGNYGAPATLSAVLSQSATSTPIGNQPVIFGLASQGVVGTTAAVAGQTAAVAGSTAAVIGQATVGMQLLSTPGTYLLQATFPGTDALAPSSATALYTVEPQATKIVLAQPGLPNNPNVTAALTDVLGQPLVEKTLFFVVSDSARSQVLYAASKRTDYAGNAALGAIPIPPGAYTVIAYFGGTIPLFGPVASPTTSTQVTDQDYLPASAQLSITPQAQSCAVAYTGETAAPVGGPLHMAAKVTGVPTGSDITLALVQFEILASGNSVPVAKIVAPVDADGTSLASTGSLGAESYTVQIQVVGSAFTSSIAYQTVTVNQATPAITGVSASQVIFHGTASVALSGTVSAAGPVYPANGETVVVTINGVAQNATIAGGTGGFSINYSAATIPASGTPYTITYSYGGDANLNAAPNNTTTTLTVNKATPTVTVTAGNYTYTGSSQGPSTFTTSPSGDTGTATWSYVGVSGTAYGPSATPPTGAGSYTAQASLTADSSFNAVSSSATSFTIGKVTPTVTVTVGSYTYSGSSQGLNAFTTSPPGDTGTATWSYVGVSGTTYGPSATPPMGAGSYTAQASLRADSNFNAASSSATSFTIGKVTPTVTTWPTASAITYGQTLASSTLSGGVATPAGNFAFTTPSTVPSVGTAPQSVTFTPTDTADYNTAVGTASVTVLADVVLNGPLVINGGTVKGSVQQLAGNPVTLNSSASITGDLLVPGTPSVVENGKATIQGTIVGTGSSTPSGYPITLNSGSSLRYLRTRINPVTIPSVPAPPAPKGTRSVTLNGAGQSPGVFSTILNLTLNGNVGQIAVPPGTYGSFIANGTSGFTLGTAGSTVPEVYDFQGLILNSGTHVSVVGPVIVVLASSFTVNGGTVGAPAQPTWLQLNIASGGLTLNGGATLAGLVTAPGGTVVLDGSSVLTGALECNQLTINSSCVLQGPGE